VVFLAKRGNKTNIPKKNETAVKTEPASIRESQLGSMELVIIKSAKDRPKVVRDRVPFEVSS
jgi:hypothetical protein